MTTKTQINAELQGLEVLERRFKISESEAYGLMSKLVYQRKQLMSITLPAGNRLATADEKKVQRLIQRRLNFEAYRARCVAIDLLSRAGS